jgi:hypothetical protein
MDVTGHAEFNVGQKETWDERLHIIEENTTNELGLSKYRCPCFYCCGGGKLVLRSIVRAYLKKDMDMI